jgi:hypothetical protein
MSKGPGKIERAILAAVDAEPDNAFTVGDLCARAYPRINRIEKRHRVAVLRAMKNVVARSGGALDWWNDGSGTIALFNRYRVLSYAMARLKADWVHHYGWSDGRVNRGYIDTQADLEAMLAPGGKKHKLVAGGDDPRTCGAWRRHVLHWIAMRDGDEQTSAVCEEISEAIKSALRMGP